MTRTLNAMTAAAIAAIAVMWTRYWLCRGRRLLAFVWGAWSVSLLYRVVILSYVAFSPAFVSVHWLRPSGWIRDGLAVAALTGALLRAQSMARSAWEAEKALTEVAERVTNGGSVRPAPAGDSGAERWPDTLAI